MNDQIFEGKVALVTGAARGIGQVIAETFADKGADVVIIDLKISSNDEVIKNIQNKGRKAYAYECDLTNVEQTRETVANIVADVGKIDFLINNAGVYPAKNVLDVDEKHFDFVVDVNLKGTFFVTQAVVKDSMLPNHYGKIVNISSSDGKMPGRGVSIYGAAKAGVISLTKSFAEELSGTGINSDAIAAGWVESAAVLAGDRWKEAIKTIPSGRLGKLSEIAESAAFLCQDNVSFINGEILDVNGGTIMD